MRKINLLLVLIIFTFGNSFSQKKLLSVDDVVLNAYSKLGVQNLRQLNWLPGSDSFVYVSSSRNDSYIIKDSPKSKIQDTILTLSVLNSYLEKIKSPALKTFPQINWASNTTFYFWNENEWLSFDIKYKSISSILKIDEASENQHISPSNKFAAYTKSNNLYLSLNDGKTIQITNDADTNIVNGQPVHRNEFGINEGIFWSPNSNYIAFYRMDQSMVTDYPLVDITKTPAQLKNIKYPMAGQTSHHVTIGIYEIKTGKLNWLKTGEPLDQYYASLSWSPDEKYFYVAHLNRDQNHLQLKKYDVATGEPVKILFEEKSDKYVEPQNQLIFLPNSNDKFLWFSQRDGFNHLYLYDTEGNFLRQVTQGKWLVTSFDGFDKNGKNLFVTTTKDTPLERHFYKVNIDNAKMQKLSNEPGIHNVKLNTDSDFYIDSYNSTTIPRIINIFEHKRRSC
jgi:dipeptidyl-peptidase-4